MLKKLVYLACPYSHLDANVRQWRFEQANAASAKLMKEGLHIFSPISHTHPIAVQCGLPLGWDFWAEYDEAVLHSCYKIIVLMLRGWKESQGIKGEIKIAERLGIEIEYMEWPII